MGSLANTMAKPNKAGVNNMRNILLAFAMLTVTGCATVENWVPSFWDDNQSARITDVRQRAHRIDCAQPQRPQAEAIVADLQWFRLYSDSKGFLQRDVIRIIEPIEKTAQDWAARSAQQEGSKTYCEMKRQVLIRQTDRAAAVILGRW